MHLDERSLHNIHFFHIYSKTTDLLKHLIALHSDFCFQAARMRVVVAVVAILALAELGSSLLIGAFNIKTFGDTKASNATLMNIISTVSNTGTLNQQTKTKYI